MPVLAQAETQVTSDQGSRAMVGVQLCTAVYSLVFTDSLSFSSFFCTFPRCLARPPFIYQRSLYDQSKTSRSCAWQYCSPLKQEQRIVLSERTSLPGFRQYASDYQQVTSGILCRGYRTSPIQLIFGPSVDKCTSMILLHIVPLFFAMCCPSVIRGWTSRIWCR